MQNERRVEVLRGAEKTAVRGQLLFIALVGGGVGFSANDSKIYLIPL